MMYSLDEGSREEAGSTRSAALLVSDDPVIIYARDLAIRESGGELGRFFEMWGDAPLYLLFSFSYHKSKKWVAQFLEWKTIHARRHPGHRMILICNTAEEEQLLAEAGQQAVWCSANAFADERLYAPVDGCSQTHSTRSTQREWSRRSGSSWQGKSNLSP